MTIRHLKIFTVVADEGGMSKAARVLHISQPSISQAISEMEKYYNVKLFERLSQKIYLTKEGEEMLSYSRHILDSFEKMEEAMSRTNGATRLRIGCSVSVGTCLIDEILDEAKRRIPDCRISVVVANSTEIEQDIMTNQVDIGMVEGILQNRELMITPICEDEMVLVCGVNHPLSQKQIITLEDLQGVDYISRESGSAERNQYEKLLEESGVQMNRVFCSTNTEAMKNAVIHGRGVAIFSKRMVTKEVKEKKIIILQVEDVMIKRNIELVIHKNKYITKEIKVVKEILNQIKFDLIS